jgi:hypothetical protein
MRNCAAQFRRRTSAELALEARSARGPDDTRWLAATASALNKQRAGPVRGGWRVGAERTAASSAAAVLAALARRGPRAPAPLNPPPFGRPEWVVWPGCRRCKKKDARKNC